jgi:hypothetical protein
MASLIRNSFDLCFVVIALALSLWVACGGFARLFVTLRGGHPVSPALVQFNRVAGAIAACGFCLVLLQFLILQLRK